MFQINILIPNKIRSIVIYFMRYELEIKLFTQRSHINRLLRIRPLSVISIVTV